MSFRSLTICALLVLVSASATFAATPATSPSFSRESFNDKYATVVDHNIFLRERGRREHTTQPSTQHSTREPLPEELVWLAGVAMEADGFRAYIEDVSGGYTFKKLAPGEPIAGGKITAIEIDAVEYEHNNKRTWITIGSDFTGKEVTVSTTSSYASTTPTEAPTTNTSTSTSQPSNSNSSNATMQSLEERMRQRRTQELRR